MEESQYTLSVNLFFLLLGWLLGLLSPILVDKIKEHFNIKKLKTGIYTELKELKYRLAGTVFSMNSKYGTLDKDLLNWLHPIVEESKGMYSKTQLELLEKLLKVNEEEFKSASENYKRYSPSALSLKKCHLPFLDSKISDLSLFNMEFQYKIFEIRAQINFLNENIEQSQFFYEKTFDSTLTDQNHKIINNNLTDSYQNISRNAKVIIDLISKLTGSESNSVKSKSGTTHS